MKTLHKILSTITAAALCAAFCGTADMAALPGDMDGDGQITPADARIVLRIAVGLEKIEDYMDAAPEGNTEDNTSQEPSVDTSPRLMFSTVDINGAPYTVNDLNGAKVVMVNFWEPWCGACKSELGDLARLYREYQDKGLLILGAYSTKEMDEEVRSLIADNGITYPVIKTAGNMSDFMTSYIPTTVFTDGTGKIISSEPEIGARSYDEWKILIEDYLAKS